MMRLAVVLWMLSALGCVGRGHPQVGHAKEAQNSAVDSDKSSLVTSANKDFAYSLYKRLAAHADSQGKNIFYSPVSVSVALAALSVGARGETHRQLFRGLGFENPELTQTDVNQAFQTLLANTVSDENINEGTALFVDKLFKPQPDFLDVLKQSYFADGFSVNFTNTIESANTINKYVADKTNGKINKLVDNLDERTLMFLVSYIYYKGKWKTPFEQELTKDDTFTVAENNTVSVQMMNKRDDFETYNDQALHTSVLHLPLSGSYSMLLLLPQNMTALENGISQADVTKWLKWMKSWRYNIYVPKFSIKTSFKLNDVLTEMGMTDMFSDRADLSGISENLGVSEIVHQATLDVDEVGATAAAVTGVKFTPLSYYEPLVLKFNRPFMVIIVERSTENVLFMGKIVNPNI
ncbi:alpha-1-antitrypsin-like protein CM55-ST [Melanotaenia boesemani]|uniref:alpha-1-antitrypsin-like protein CM55-ST n=1 Tax=Melanotaenia boesemani TaxID=1250792 RepID=UPI001C05D45C|nr:alpha-1-antitrypsin-like protein CM55-ST [Melanotaenia boesemani]